MVHGSRRTHRRRRAEQSHGRDDGRENVLHCRGRHACGKDFLAAKHLAAHPELSWQKSELRDMKAFPWTTVAAQ